MVLFFLGLVGLGGGLDLNQIGMLTNSLGIGLFLVLLVLGGGLDLGQIGMLTNSPLPMSPSPCSTQLHLSADRLSNNHQAPLQPKQHYRRTTKFP